MSNRRLAPDEVQPASFAFSADNLAWAKEQIAKFPPGRQASAVIPLLWRAQEQHANWLPKAAMETIADMLAMPYIRVLEVATFYTMFQLQPVGTKAHVQVCGTTPCMIRGADKLIDICKHRIHHDPFHLSADGAFSWEEVECAGACVNAPMIQVFSDTYEDLTPETFEKVLDAFARGDKPTPGPQNGRHGAEPAGGALTLRDLPFAAAGPAGVAVADKPVAASKAAASIMAAPAPAAPAHAPAVSDADKPANLLASARGGKADDLELIWGVGPKLAAMLNRMGIFHFDQIAAFKAHELAWVDANLEGFKGRAVRDKWTEQATRLATGWRPEKGVGDKPV